MEDRRRTTSGSVARTAVGGAGLLEDRRRLAGTPLRSGALLLLSGALFLSAALLLGSPLASGSPLAPSSRLAAQSGIGPALGSPAPEATLEDLDGHPVQLMDVVGGKPALIEFWATWCPLCEELQPQLDRIQREYGDRLRIVAVAVAVNQNPRRIRRHLADHDPGYPYLYDAGGEAVRGYRAATTSVVVILDAEGRVAYTGVGADQDLVAAVREVLGEGH